MKYFSAITFILKGSHFAAEQMHVTIKELLAFFE